MESEISPPSLSEQVELFSEQSKSFKVSGEIFLHGQCRVPKRNCLQGDSRMFQLIKYLKSNLMKADNLVYSGKRSGKISRIYVLNPINNKERLLYVTGIFFIMYIHSIYSYVCAHVRIYIAEKCHEKSAIICSMQTQLFHQTL